jgi:uncharacterized protein (DUF2147 family)
LETEGETQCQDRGFERTEDQQRERENRYSDPDPTKRGHPIIGLVFICGFAKKSNPRREDGTVYEPKSGKTYSCNNGPAGTDKSKVRGFIGIELIGRDYIWTD